jgi:hypothetical protein
MMAITFGPHDLLQYNPRYRVLICQECQYGIQKSALRSHLLRHKIYRDERQRLLSAISQLDLLEPGDVSIPGPTSAPIDALPIISGYRCTKTGCEHLYASSKRMRGHQVGTHGPKGIRNDSWFARPIKIQTFFRGTKIRYFEITTSPVDVTLGVTSCIAILNDNDNDQQEEEVPNALDALVNDADIPPQYRIASPTSTRLQSSPIHVDLEALSYFHQFTTVTSLTLPGTKRPESTIHYWQMDAVLLALQR